MALSSRPARQARLSRSVEKAFGEFFTITATRATDDPNGRRELDPDRVEQVGVIGTFHAPGKSQTPTARGSTTDDRMHNWTASHPSVHFDDASLLWQVEMGDVITRILDGAVYVAAAPLPTGFGRTAIPLTSRKR